jgi:hypothetical protein
LILCIDEFNFSVLCENGTGNKGYQGLRGAADERPLDVSARWLQHWLIIASDAYPISLASAAIVPWFTRQDLSPAA